MILQHGYVHMYAPEALIYTVTIKYYWTTVMVLLLPFISTLGLTWRAAKLSLDA